MASQPGIDPVAPIPDYDLIRKIGQGGYGEVWLARGITGVLRAVKIVRRDRFAEAGPFEREFRGLRESMALSTETGPLALLHAGQNESAGFFYYVMELADDAERGRDIDPARYVPLTLKELRARRGRLPAAECLAHGRALTRSLAALHARGLLHRDIKPSNAILVNGTAKLADVGLVSPIADAHTFVGTEGFVPPEGPGTAAADVFALGKVLYELATGLERTEFPQMPAELGAPAERKAFFALNQILVRACDPSPARRYRDAAAMLVDLEMLHAGRAVRTGRQRRNYGLLLAAAAIVSLTTFVAVRRPWQRASTTALAPTLSPARQLVAKAWEALHRSPEPFRAELDAASEFCRRAAELDNTDAQVWAAWAHVESWYVTQNVDRSNPRRESARTKAARAMQLAPASYEARLAHACRLVLSEGFAAIHAGDRPAVEAVVAEAEPALRALLAERPDEPRALFALGKAFYLARRTNEAAAEFDRLARNPAWTATAYTSKAWALREALRWDEASEAVQRAIAAKPFFGNLSLQIGIAQNWLGDLDLAKRAVEQIPAADLREDSGMIIAVTVYWRRREPQPMLRLLRATPRDWVQTNGWVGPKDYLVGVAHDLAGNPAAAQLAWKNALRLVAERLAADPNNRDLHNRKGQLLALLAERESARTEFELARQLGASPRAGAVELGDVEQALPGLERSPWAWLRDEPRLDPLRHDPRFQALLAEAENDPERSPRAKRTP